MCFRFLLFCQQPVCNNFEWERESKWGNDCVIYFRSTHFRSKHSPGEPLTHTSVTESTASERHTHSSNEKKKTTSYNLHMSMFNNVVCTFPKLELPTTIQTTAMHVETEKASKFTTKQTEWLFHLPSICHIDLLLVGRCCCFFRHTHAFSFALFFNMNGTVDRWRKALNDNQKTLLYK